MKIRACMEKDIHTIVYNDSGGSQLSFGLGEGLNDSVRIAAVDGHVQLIRGRVGSLEISRGEGQLIPLGGKGIGNDPPAPSAYPVDKCYLCRHAIGRLLCLRDKAGV